MKKLIFILIAGLMSICGYSQIVCDSTERVKLKQQVEDVMKANEVVNSELDVLYTNYRAFETKTKLKEKQNSTLIKGLVIGGSIYVAITLPILIYFIVK